MATWEQTASRVLRVLRLESIRNKILVFAVAATLIPSLTTAWLSYTQSRRSVGEKIRDNLQTVSSQTARDVDLWMKERLYELRVFTGSYEVSENLERISREQGSVTRRSTASERLNDYLSSVRERFKDYEELFVLDAQGRIVARSARRPEPVELPEDWLHRVQAGGEVVGATSWDPQMRKTVMLVAVAIEAPNRRFLGALTAMLNLRSVDEVLRNVSDDVNGRVYLITPQGARIVTAPSPTPELDQAALDAGAVRRLLEQEALTVEYTAPHGGEVLGTLKKLTRVDWGVVAEVPPDEAFRQVERLRNWTLLMVTALLLGLGSVAYLLGLLIVRPLDRLTAGAAKVAAGDLDVDLPVVSGGEVGGLTEVFNDMVDRLREKNEELEELSVTDELTGLFNRRHLMEALASEVRRSERHHHRFALLIADIDRFKDYNDKNGHLAGDTVLTHVGAILRECLRTVDLAARYGGEEFVAILPETAIADAFEVAERIRADVAGERFEGGRVTVSLGVAEFPAHGDSSETLLAAADAALYRAKREGRNRVLRAGPDLKASAREA
ncbi:MAG: sensor domain-containing diguanylate cyclase [Gemmatimonadota bacterium]